MGLILPSAGERAAALLADEILLVLYVTVRSRVAAGACHPGDDGEAAISRARARPNLPPDRDTGITSEMERKGVAHKLQSTTIGGGLF